MLSKGITGDESCGDMPTEGVLPHVNDGQVWSHQWALTGVSGQDRCTFLFLSERDASVCAAAKEGSHHSHLHQRSIRQQERWDPDNGWGPWGSAESELLGAMCQKGRSQSWLLHLKLRLRGWPLKGVKKIFFPFVNTASVQQQSLRDYKYWSWKQHLYPVTVFIPRPVFWTIN